MPADNPRDALEAFLQRFRRVAECVTAQPVIAPRDPTSPVARIVRFAPPGQPAALRGKHGPRRILLHIVHNCDVVVAEATGRTFVVTTAYSYRILDPDERELLAFHWHPVGRSSVTFPHLHLTSRVRPIEIGRGLDPVALAEIHIPTGPVRFADVVRLLIAEFGVTPRRADCDAVLAGDAP